MRQRFYLPRAVISDIADHFTQAIDETEASFYSACEDEDALTGHLGGKLTTRQRLVNVVDDEINGIWRWSLSYRKFRGRGKGAPERTLGADGIFELVFDNSKTTSTKSILFQSKMAGAGGRDLVDQCARLSTWREAAFVMLYAPTGFRAITLDAVLQEKGKVENAPSDKLASFLTQQFVGCRIGDNDLRYRPETRELSWYSVNDETVGVRFSIPNRLRLKVMAPRRNDGYLWIDKRIEADQLHRHRMKSALEDVLRVQHDETGQLPSKAFYQLARVYHTDLFNDFSSETRELLNARLQEFNQARSELEPGKPLRRSRPRGDQESSSEAPETDGMSRGPIGRK